MTHITVGISFEEGLLHQIDLKRGDIPRSKFVNRIVKDKLEAKVKQTK